MPYAHRNSFLSSGLYAFLYTFLAYCTGWIFYHYVSKNGRAVILALSLILGKSIQFFTLKYDVSCKFSIDVLYQVTEVSLSSCFSHSFFFIMNEYRILENAFYLPIDKIMWFFSFSLLVNSGLYWFLNTEPTLYPWKKLHLVMAHNSLYISEFYLLISH